MRTRHFASCLLGLAVAGCAAAPVAPVPGAPTPRLVLAPVVGQPAAPAARGATKVLRDVGSAPAPRSGRWLIAWELGGTTHSDTYELGFEPDGAVVVIDADGDRRRYPEALVDGQARFEGAVHREVVGHDRFSRERFDLAAESAVSMSGTRAVRVNARWVAMPARATYQKAAPVRP